MAHAINDSCTKCNLCVDECPTNSIMVAEPYFIIDADTCTDCKACVSVCPVDAIHPLKAP